MTSLFDALFCDTAAPSLMTHFGVEGSVSIELKGKLIVCEATGILRAERTTEEYQDDRIVKRIDMEIDLLRDEIGFPLKGLERNTTASTAIVNDVRWNIEGIENRTDTMVTFKLFRRTMQERSTSGFRRQES